MENCRGIDLILRVVLAWATAQPKIRAVALVGSHTRGTAGPASDIDLVLLTTPPDPFHYISRTPELIELAVLTTAGRNGEHQK